MNCYKFIAAFLEVQILNQIRIFPCGPNSALGILCVLCLIEKLVLSIVIMNCNHRDHAKES